jgi:ABC-2 type transport system ATP-binding protein
MASLLWVPQRPRQEIIVMSDAVEIFNISKSYGKRSILHDVCLRAEAGDQVAIIGRNGSGKSTLLQILAGIIKPDRGSSLHGEKSSPLSKSEQDSIPYSSKSSPISESKPGCILYYGIDVLKHRKELVRLCGYLPQANPLAEELSVQDNLSLWSGRLGKPDPVLIEDFQLEEILKTPVRKLSGGMKRRVSIACAVIRRPPILIMDEPTASLDIVFKKEIRDWMKSYRERNGTIILATHDEAEIRESSRCCMVENGTLTECGPQVEL